MNKELLKLKDKLNSMMKDESPASEEVLKLSREVDILIMEYYRQNFIKSKCNHGIVQ